MTFDSTRHLLAERLRAAEREAEHVQKCRRAAKRMLSGKPPARWTQTSGRPLEDYPLVVQRVFGDVL